MQIINNKIMNTIIAMDKSKSYRLYLTDTTQMVNKAAQIHKTFPLASVALGRLLTGAGLMAHMQKDHTGKLTIQMKGDGQAGEILATATKHDASVHVKGYISNPQIDAPSVGDAVGIGTLTVIKHVKDGQPYVGKIDISTGEIADDLTAYFFISEQQNTSVALGVSVGFEHGTINVNRAKASENEEIENPQTHIDAAGGMIIQMMPGHDPDVVDYLEQVISSMPRISDVIKSIGTLNVRPSQKISATSQLNKHPLQDALNMIFESVPELYKPHILELRDIIWECDCSQKRLEQVLLTLGKKELEELATTSEPLEMVCQFCTKKYYFTKEMLERILCKIS